MCSTAFVKSSQKGDPLILFHVFAKYTVYHIMASFIPILLVSWREPPFAAKENERIELLYFIDLLHLELAYIVTGRNLDPLYR
jgi:hypothetical protein